MNALVTRISAATSSSSSSESDQYMPHPAPEHEPVQKSKMGAAGALFKTLIIPAAISLGIYLLTSYLIIPIWQKYRGRYSRYIPLESISSHTGSWRQRMQSTLSRYLLPSAWRANNQQSRFIVNAENEFDEEGGEELYEVDRRREALSLDASRGRQQDNDRRLSRDLEEGFRDDSEEDESATAARA